MATAGESALKDAGPKTSMGAMVHGSLASALAAFQSEIPSVVKGATAEVQTKAGGTYKYQYADLAVITPLVLPLLGRHGLAWSTQPTSMGDQFILHYSLTHESGEAIEGIYPLPDPASIKPQELGSAITYARRYALCAVTGVAPGGDDDDAAAANDRPAASRRQAGKRPSPEAAPIEAPKLTKDWASLASEKRDQESLGVLYREAEALGELGLLIPETNSTVGRMFFALRAQLPPVAETTPEETPTPEPLPEPEPAPEASADAVEWPEVAKPGGDAA